MKFRVTWRVVSAVLFVAVLVLSACLVYMLMEKTSEYSHVYLGELKQEEMPAGKKYLQFEESLVPSLPEYINQVDYALIQLLNKQSLHLPEILSERSDLTDSTGQNYTYKTIRIYAGHDAQGFVRNMHDSVVAWAEQAVLVQDLSPPSLLGEQGIWNVFIHGVKTHTIIIFSGDFPIESGTQNKAVLVDSPKIVIVIDDLGESMSQMQRLLKLDYTVTCAIWPRSSHATAAAVTAFDAGREVIIHQPMEPIAYPQVDPGDGAILSNMTDDEIRTCLARNFRLVPYASGLNNHMGSRVTQDMHIMKIIAAELKLHGYIILDSMTHAKSRFHTAGLLEGATVYKRNIFLDVVAEKGKVIEQLRKAENIALMSGQSIAIGHPYPATLEALEEWQRLRNKKVQIVHLRDLEPLGNGQ